MGTASVHDIARTIAKFQLANPNVVQEAMAKYPDNPGKAVNLLVKNAILTPWQASRLIAGDHQGYRFGKYCVKDRLGATPIARIYLSHDIDSGEPTRIIAFRRRHTIDARQVEKLRNALEPFLGWKHPHVVNMITLGYEPQEGQHYLATEIPPKTTFSEHIKTHGTLPPEEVLHTLELVAQTMAAALARKGVHGNISPESLLLTSEGSIKLDEWAWPTCFDHTLGAEAPDCHRLYNALSESTKIPLGDVRNDIFFLGCLMHQAVIGVDPLAIPGSPPSDRVESMIPIGNETLPGSPRLARIIQSMTSKAIDKRFPSPVTLLDEVKQAQRAQNARSSGDVAGTTVFVLENELELQNVIRERFREYGYRVFIAADPARALERYGSTPFDAAVIDVGHLGVEVLDAVDQLRAAAGRADQRLRIVLLLDRNQSHISREYPNGRDLTTLIRPFSVGRIHRTLQGLN
jgi:CheY-like chemotaxis protein